MTFIEALTVLIPVAVLAAMCGAVVSAKWSRDLRVELISEAEENEAATAALWRLHERSAADVYDALEALRDSNGPKAEEILHQAIRDRFSRQAREAAFRGEVQ